MTLNDDINLRFESSGDINLKILENGQIDVSIVNDGDINLILDAPFSKFRHLTDTPDSYEGQSLKQLRVNLGETGIEFFEFEETDPVFSVSPASTITATQINHWDLAYGWGNHALAGYLTHFNESDPVWTAEKNNYYTKSQINAFNEDFITDVNWGDINGQISDQADLNEQLNLKTNQTDFVEHTSDTSNPHEVTKAQIGLDNVNNTSDVNKPISSATQVALDSKVDKVSGKTLTSNDFTNAYKTKLDETEIYTETEKNKLAGIQAGAEVNVNADWNATSGDSQILNKPDIDYVLTFSDGLSKVGTNVTNSDKGSSAVSTHESTYDHTLIATALQDISGQDLSTADNSTSQFITQLDIDWSTNVPLNETDPVFTSSPANSISQDDITNLGNLSGSNTGDQESSDFTHNDLSGLQGGTTNELYHLTSAEQGYLSGQDQAIKTTSDVTFNTMTATEDLIIPLDAPTSPVAGSTAFFDNALQIYDGANYQSADCPKLIYLNAVNQSEGDLHLTDANWNVNKAIIKSFTFETTSTDYTIYLVQNDNGIITDDAVLCKKRLIVKNGSGNGTYEFNDVYTDEDGTKEIHLNYSSASGSEPLTSIGARGVQAR